MTSFSPSYQPEPTTTQAATPAQISGLSLCNDVVFKTLSRRYPLLLADLINAVRHHAAPIRVDCVLNPNILTHDWELVIGLEQHRYASSSLPSPTVGGAH